ncbi:uncharacterized protein LOC116171966 isoform X3 [Photinus pyralis]|uniref:uncharacterized protein LOC116171966 isoform X3 n=1 Tax=Photinus pyralis TaxID=7054 RepID=UPI0012672BAD|nr:uncharacterized protein LOC116171966 isoform X3 [Photinus pyralis]
MPSESLTVAVTSGFGIGIIAGIVSGVCYILVHGVSVNRPRRNNQWHCSTCGERFRSIGGVLDLDKVVTCRKCGGKICRKCASRDQENWICQTCLHPESWFKGMLKALQPSSINLPVVGESPCSAHASLKFLIQKVIQDAISLPILKKVDEQPGAPVDEINRSYEDLLATAIINKVIENYQDELPTSSANSVSSRRSNLSIRNNREYFFGEETLDAKWRNCNSAAGDVDTTSVSSMEEWVQSGSSSCSTKYVDHKSLTIQHRIEEASSSDEEDSRKEWQENWKLQRRQFAGSASPIPVPMLVPNPTVVAKVLIGDREADDTTDLSDAASECDETERLKCPKVESEDEVLSDGTTDDVDIAGEKDRILEQFSSYQPDCSLDANIWEFVNTNVNYSENFEDTSLDSHIEQDSEYTEKYATLPKTILKCSTPVNSVNDPYVNSVNDRNNLEILSNGDIHTETAELIDGAEPVEINEELRKKFEGSYSEREKQKWNNAVEMKNNPYTEENINRRLKTSSVMASLFGRDYYIKEAAKAAGARNAKDVNHADAGSEKQEKPSNETASSGFIFTAVPAIVNADSSYNTDSESLIEIGSPAPPSSLFEISSDSDLSIERTYNLTSGKVYEKVGNLHKEIVKRTSSPEGLKFVTIASEMVDENHNSMTSRKRTFLRSLTDSDDGDITMSIAPNCEVFCQNTNISNVPLNDQTFEVESLDYADHNRSFSVQEVSIDFSTETDIKTSAESSLNSTHDSEIGDLKQQHLVKDRLGQLSRSYPNLASKKVFGKFHNEIEEVKICVAQATVIPLQNGFEDGEKCVSPEELSTSAHDTSVNDLRKRFAKVHGDESLMQKQVHSLTARSIPHLIRKELQESEQKQESHNYGSDATKQEEVGLQAAQLEEATVIKEKPVLSTFPNAKSRIKFFENLNR